MTVLVDKLEKELARNCRLNNWDLGFKAAIDIVKQHNEWVSVSERLPDEDGFYLCVVQTGAIDKIKSINKVGFENRATGGYFRLGDWQSVTHWMPIPQPPSEVQGG